MTWIDDAEQAAEAAERHHEDEEGEQEADDEAPVGRKLLHPPGGERGQGPGVAHDAQRVPGLSFMIDFM